MTQDTQPQMVETARTDIWLHNKLDVCHACIDILTEKRKAAGGDGILSIAVALHHNYTYYVPAVVLQRGGTAVEGGCMHAQREPTHAVMERASPFSCQVAPCSEPGSGPGVAAGVTTTTIKCSRARRNVKNVTSLSKGQGARSGRIHACG